MHVGTPPTGELGALGHLDSFVSSVPHSSFSSRCSKRCLHVPFGDEVPDNHGPMLKSPSHGGLQPENSSTATSKKSSLPCCKAFRSRLHTFLKIKSNLQQNKSTPNHLRIKQIPPSTSQSSSKETQDTYHTPQLPIHKGSSTHTQHTLQYISR